MVTILFIMLSLLSKSVRNDARSMTTARAVCNGTVEFITGPMFAGKTTELLKRIQHYKSRRLNPLLITSNKDNRYSNTNGEYSNIISHDKKSMRSHSTDRLMKLVDHALLFDVIAVDELQFFNDNDVAQFCDTMTNHGKIVITAGLSGDFRKESFQSVCRVLPRCERVTRLSAVCMGCGHPAHFTRRLPGKPPQQDIQPIKSQQIQHINKVKEQGEVEVEVEVEEGRFIHSGCQKR
mmetsp:Transcript_32360/g.32976  ORF Transcript_32360/g.32976 Transcript_32360/m.32976 type:complete len:236 (+) Transcript_32360:157-864(+)